MDNYTSKAIVTTIKATSRAAVKIGDNYYTVEYSEERQLPDTTDIDLPQEQDILFDSVNTVVDTQVADILKTFKKK